MIIFFFLTLFIAGIAFLAASETALFSLSSFTLQSYRNDFDHRKRLIAHLLERPRELLISVMIGNIFFSILVQNTISSLFGSYTSWVLKVGVPLLLILFFGELFPKSLALSHNQALAYRVAPFLAFFSRLLKPIRKILFPFVQFLSRWFFPFSKEKEVSEEELRFILESSKEKGILSAEESHWVEDFLLWKEFTVKEVMSPIQEVPFYNVEEPIDAFFSQAKNPHAFPLLIIEKDLAHPLGFLFLSQFLSHRSFLVSSKELLKFLQKPFFAPESSTAKNLFFHMRKQGQKVALVVDEYGSIEGRVLEEDLLEPFWGKREEAKEEKAFLLLGKNEVIADGRWEIREFETFFHKKLLSTTSPTTLGGWLIDQLGEIPQAGTKYTTEDFFFHVLVSEPKCVKKIYVRVLKNHG